MPRPRPLPPGPTESARIARAAFPKGHPYLRAADEFGGRFTDDTFAALFPRRDQPALAPWRLALATMLQFAEGLSDRQTADAVRARLDWKYVLRLEPTDPGFDASVLCEFRGRLVAGEAEQLLPDALPGWSRERGLLKARGQQRTDSTHVLAVVRALNRLEVVGETLRHALDSLAVAAPDWLRARTMPEWGERYGRRVEDARRPRGQAAREALAVSIGDDGHVLLAALYAPGEPAWLREIPAVETLRRVWVQQFRLDAGAVRWRASGDIPPAAVFIGSPHDADAHYARKDTTSWVGYKLHVTETCEVDQPQLITHVGTTSAPVVDLDAVPPIHRAPRERDLLPRVHLADSGYRDALQLVTSREEFGVELFGPSRRDYHWQARERTGYDIEHFRIDWEHQRATCPAGRTSSSWRPDTDRRGNPVISIKFAAKDCGPRASRPQCCRSRAKYPRRMRTVRPQAHFEALRAARQREATPSFAAAYALRAGIEGTLARGIRRCRLRRTRYIGQAKVHLGHSLAATGLNFLRLGEWFADTPRPKPRRTPFAALRARPLAASLPSA